MPERTGLVLLAIVTLISSSCGRTATSRQPGATRYPATPVVEASDVYHGTRVADPYRWLEDLAAPKTREWAAAQDQLTQPFLADPRTRSWLKSRMDIHADPFDEAASDDVTTVGDYHFRITDSAAGGDSVLTVQRGSDAARVLVDPRQFGASTSISRFQVSPDATYVAYALSDGGSDWVETRIRTVATGQDLPETVDGLLFEPPVWTHDGRGFFYVFQRRPPASERTMLKGAAIRYHVAGTPQASDRAIFTTPGDNIELVLDVELSDDGRFAFLYEGTGAHWGGIGWVLTRLHILDLRHAKAPDLSTPLVALTPTRDAAYRVVAAHGDTLLVLTDRGAPRRRLVAVDLRAPAPENWRDVMPESTGVLQAVREIHDRLVALYLDNVQDRVRVFSSNGQLIRELATPPMSTALDVKAGDSSNQLVVSTTSAFVPPTRTAFDVTTGVSTILSAPKVQFDAANYETQQVWYSSKDGTRIPMFLMHRKGIPRDGSHPTLMRGYGASGTVMMPEYAEDVLAWLELGGIFALPNLRGGGEFGRAWYDAAILDRKQTTFDDFIAAAEYLISQRYTAASRLAIQGGSNGGQLVAAVITQRPELFGVAIAEVPITDNLRYDRGRHRAQFGTPTDATQFPFLFAYSPLHRVKVGTCYPATLVTTSLNDDRAPAWHAMKLVAALQAAQACDRPILLRADDVGGHFGARGADSPIENAADILTFTARQLGITIK